MRRLLNWYQYLGPIVLGPLSYWLWLLYAEDNHGLVIFALSVPIIYSYVVPAVGTNVLKVWEFDTKLRLGRFRPHHGFVFGSATAVLSLPFILFGPQGGLETGLVLGIVLGLVNWLYDAAAIKAGFLMVYNQPFADGRGPAIIAADYSPFFFGLFGFVYGYLIRNAEQSLTAVAGWSDVGALISFSVLIVIVVPVATYIAYSKLRHGHFGCRPVFREGE